MKRLFTVFILLAALQLPVFSAELNIHNILKIDIPDEFEILSISELLGSHPESDQYCLSIYIDYIYGNRNLFLVLDLFGYGDEAKYNSLAEILELDNSYEYYPVYRTADQKKYLKENYQINRETNSHNLGFSRFVSSWPSGISSDYYGFYFSIDNEYFQEVIIHSINYWSSFGGDCESLDDKNFRQEIASLNEDGKRLMAFMDNIIDSVVPPRSSVKIIRNKSLEIKNTGSLQGYWVNETENTELYAQPDPASEVLDHTGCQPYVVIGTGPDVIIDGKQGRWYRIASYVGTRTGWIFSGFLRELDEEELENYLE